MHLRAAHKVGVGKSGRAIPSWRVVCAEKSLCFHESSSDRITGDVKSDAVANSKNPVKTNVTLLCVCIKRFGFICLNHFRFWPESGIFSAIRLNLNCVYLHLKVPFSAGFPRWMGLVNSHWASPMAAAEREEEEEGWVGGYRGCPRINEPVDQIRPPDWQWHSSPISPGGHETASTFFRYLKPDAPAEFFQSTSDPDATVGKPTMIWTAALLVVFVSSAEPGEIKRTIGTNACSHKGGNKRSLSSRGLLLRWATLWWVLY